MVKPHFLDTSSNSSSSSYSYKVRLLDNCDVVSSESSLHKTILLQSSLATDNSVNLSWTSYEGVNYSTYKIYRRVNNGDFEELTLFRLQIILTMIQMQTLLKMLILITFL